LDLGSVFCDDAVAVPIRKTAVRRKKAALRMEKLPVNAISQSKWSEVAKYILPFDEQQCDRASFGLSAQIASRIPG
jgi:hypothetical protein